MKGRGGAGAGARGRGWSASGRLPAPAHGCRCVTLCWLHAGRAWRCRGSGRARARVRTAPPSRSHGPQPRRPVAEVLVLVILAGRAAACVLAGGRSGRFRVCENGAVVLPAASPRRCAATLCPPQASRPTHTQCSPSQNAPHSRCPPPAAGPPATLDLPFGCAIYECGQWRGVTQHNSLTRIRGTASCTPFKTPARCRCARRVTNAPRRRLRRPTSVLCCRLHGTFSFTFVACFVQAEAAKHRDAVKGHAKGGGSARPSSGEEASKQGGVQPAGPPRDDETQNASRQQTNSACRSGWLRWHAPAAQPLRPHRHSGTPVSSCSRSRAIRATVVMPSSSNNWWAGPRGDQAGLVAGGWARRRRMRCRAPVRHPHAAAESPFPSPNTHLDERPELCEV